MPIYYYNWEEINVDWEALNLNWENLKVNTEICSWDNINILWNDLNVNWEDVCPVVQVISGGVIWTPSPESLKKYHKKDASTGEETKRVIIKILAKIDDEEFIEYKYKNKNNVKVIAKNINLIANGILNNIKVNVQNIS